MDLNKNYYHILGVDKNADDTEVKKAFRNLSKTHHPDKGGDDNKFKEINEASSVLSDTQKRNRYDNSSPHGKNFRNSGFQNMNGFNFSYKESAPNYGDPFESYRTSFGGDIEDFLRRSGFGSFQRNDIFEDLDIKININISLEEIYNNRTKEFTYIRNVPCNTCAGSGEVNMSGHVTCHHCTGSGRMNLNGRDTICNNCSGTGRITKKVCNDCNGSKLKAKKETVPLTNLFILSDSERSIAYNNYGNYSKFVKDKVGRLILTLTPIFGEKYKKVGKDLYFKTKIDFKTAILGGSFEYEHLDGKISIKIPDKTNNGSRLKLKDKGLIMSPAGNRGDLYIDVEVYIDYDKLTDSNIEILKTLK